MKVAEGGNGLGSIHRFISEKNAFDNFYPWIDERGKPVVGNGVVKMITVSSMGRKSKQIPFARGEGNTCIELQIPELPDEFTGIAGFDFEMTEWGGAFPFELP